MKIVIDARFWGPSHSGLGIYTRELVYALAIRDSHNEYTLFLRQGMLTEPTIPKGWQKIAVEAKAYTLWEQVLVAAKLYQLQPDLVHFPSINTPVLYFGKFVVTVHDLIKHQSRGPATTTHNPILYWPKYLLYHFVTWWAIKFSQKIIVPSQDVKNKIIQHYKIDQQKITVTYEAAVLPAKSGEKVKLPSKFIFYVGNAYPHKNLARLAVAMNQIYTKTGTKLVIASGRDIFSQRLAKIASDRIIFLGSLYDSQLTYVHQKAQAYVFPTLIEGFGIPALDAMTFGVPVVCSRIPVLQEIYGSAAHYFDPSDPDDISKKVIEVLTDKRLRQNLVKLGHDQVKRYSWAKTAQQTLNVYESCFSLRSNQ